MKPAFHTQYRPLTSRPFLQGDSYAEYPPCQLLTPYIACFWESDNRGMTGYAMDQGVLVIPDTCIDIIIELDHTSQTIKSRICGLADSPTLIKRPSGSAVITTFAVRFYFWAAHLFLNVEMKVLFNQVFNFQLLDPEGFREFEALFYLSGTGERIAWMENLLLRRLQKKMPEIQYNPSLFNSIDRIIKSFGNISVKEICEYSCTGQRQMERLFLHNIGISIKRTSNLVRYQNVWRDIVYQKQFDVQNAVYRYGYSDQPHLLKEFKRFHGVTPKQAKQIALINR